MKRTREQLLELRQRLEDKHKNAYGDWVRCDLTTEQLEEILSALIYLLIDREPKP